MLYRKFVIEEALTAAALEHYAGMMRGKLLALLSSELGFSVVCSADLSQKLIPI
jgi:hypothetical protein